MEKTIFIVCIKEDQANDFLRAFQDGQDAVKFKKEYLKEYSHISPDMKINIFEEILN